MNQKRISTCLIAAGVIAGLGILCWAALYAPMMAQEALSVLTREGGGPAAAQRPETLYWVGLCGVWVTSAILLLALAEYLMVSVRIGRDRSFCPENVRSLFRIALYLLFDGVLWLIAIFVPGLLGYPCGPAWLIFLLAALAHFALSLLAWSLGKLLGKAVSIQQENELTV